MINTKIHKFKSGFAVLFAILAMALPSGPVLAQEVPVMLNDTGEDACSTGEIAGLDPNGDGFLAVRSGPGTNYAQHNSVFNGDRVSICDSDGDWLGIIFGRDGCVGGSPEGATQNGPYSGSCLKGWVFGRYVQLLAG